MQANSQPFGVPTDRRWKQVTGTGVLPTHLPKGPLVSSGGRRPGLSCCPWKGPASERSGNVRFRGGVMTTPCRARRVSKLWELGVLGKSDVGLA